MLERSKIGNVAVERSLSRDALGFAVGLDGTFVEPARKAKEPRAFRSVPACQFALAGALEVADGPQSVARETLLRHLADPENQTDRFRGKKGSRLSGAQDCESARFVEVGRDLGQKLVAGEADRDGDGELLLHLGGKSRQRFGGAGSMHAGDSRQIHESFVDRDRFDQGRELEHERPYLARDTGIFLHVRPDDAGMWAQAVRLEHGHRRSHAKRACHVTGSEHDTAGAAADDYGLVRERWVIAFLDRGIERIAVDMGHAQRIDLGMAQQSRGAARAAAADLIRHVMAAIAAEARHVTRCRWVGPVARMSAAICGDLRNGTTRISLR